MQSCMIRKIMGAKCRQSPGECCKLTTMDAQLNSWDLLFENNDYLNTDCAGRKFIFRLPGNEYKRRSPDVEEHCAIGFEPVRSLRTTAVAHSIFLLSPTFFGKTLKRSANSPVPDDRPAAAWQLLPGTSRHGPRANGLGPAEQDHREQFACEIENLELITLKSFLGKGKKTERTELLNRRATSATPAWSKGDFFGNSIFGASGIRLEPLYVRCLRHACPPRQVDRADEESARRRIRANACANDRLFSQLPRPPEPQVDGTLKSGRGGFTESTRWIYGRRCILADWSASSRNPGTASGTDDVRRTLYSPGNPDRALWESTDDTVCCPPPSFRRTLIEAGLRNFFPDPTECAKPSGTQGPYDVHSPYSRSCRCNNGKDAEGWRNNAALRIETSPCVRLHASESSPGTASD